MRFNVSDPRKHVLKEDGLFLVYMNAGNRPLVLKLTCKWGVLLVLLLGGLLLRDDVIL